MDNTNTFSNIIIAYKHLVSDINLEWKKYNLLKNYLPIIHNSIKKDLLPLITIKNLPGTSEKEHNKDITYGLISSQVASLEYDTLIRTWIIFEEYITKIVRFVYEYIPEKLIGSDENEKRFHKLSQVIVESLDKKEMIDKLIEEKLRSIFYGNLADIFLKDSCRVGFEHQFKDGYSDSIKKLANIIALRNIIVHNQGIVDSKYIKETNKSVKIGSKAKIDEEYLSKTLLLLTGIGAVSAYLISIKTLAITPKGKVIEIKNRFDAQRAIHGFFDVLE